MNPPIIESVILGAEQGPNGWAWRELGAAELVCDDEQLVLLLDKLGRLGYRLVASGGADPNTGFGPTRLILSRLVKVPETEPVSKFRGLGDEL